VLVNTLASEINPKYLLSAYDENQGSRAFNFFVWSCFLLNAREIAFTKKLITQLRVFSAKTRVLRLAVNAVSLSNRIKRRLAFYMNSQETGGFLQR
jgi:hypothetical protein